MKQQPITVRKSVAHGRAFPVLLWLLVVFGASAPAAAAEVSIVIKGISGKMEESARASLALSQYVNREVNALEVRRLVADGDEEIRKALEAFGYYNPTVQSELQRTERGDFRAIFTINPGAPVTVSTRHLKVLGPASDEQKVRAAVESFQPREGERFVHSVYEESKAGIATALRSLGFRDAKTTERRVEITTATNSADIHLVWESGVRYRLGEVNFSNSQFPERFLQRYVPWEEGGYYSTDSLLTLQQRLVAADYFTSVSVQPKFDEAENQMVPIDVLLVPDERTVYSAGLFVSTDFGPGGRLDVERRWLNRRGHKAGGALEYAPRLQEASITYQIPRPGIHERDYNFGVSSTDEQSESARSRSTRIAAAEARRRWHGFTRSMGVQYLTGDFEIAGEQTSSSVSYVDASLSRMKADDQRFTRGGYSVRLALRGGPEFFLSDTAFLQFHGAGKWIRGFGDNSRIVMRGELGAMTVGNFHALPPSLRFFAGGDRSIRGFGYQAIGDTNESGGVIGGEYLITASGEYEYYFGEKWGAAVFVDTGDAFRSNLNLNVGAGLGVRWKSPIGIVRLDLARPLVTHFGDSWRVHLAIGPDL